MMIEVLACIGFVAGIYSVWMSLANKREAQRLREIARKTRDEMFDLFDDIKTIGATSRRLDGDLQNVRGDLSLISQDVKEYRLDTLKTNADMQRVKSAMLEGSKVADKWFAGDA